MERGYIEVYTGNGKGKTTAMIGLTVRAVGANLKVFIGQFMKDAIYSEIKALRERFPEVTIEQFGSGKGFVHANRISDKDIESASYGYKRSLEALTSSLYDVVILDEINVAAFMNIISKKEVLDLMDKKPPNVELVLTGRYASPEVIEKADLVTEMKDIKHYFEKGVQGRYGIEK
ncbi:MAG: cob(I)yrinic acid a,c-diamide adenosyltransferase [Oscillospiraceae bacterium]|nr:cob(I)yrinic acid a,c-diamide adenosyltransferase [Oscillospiraceae bacterium]